MRKVWTLVKPAYRRAERRPAPDLTARFGLDPASVPARVKDIGTLGIYLITEKRPPLGELVTLTLEEEGKLGGSIELQFTVDARVARQGKVGIGLAFVLPPGLDRNLWGVLVKNIVVLRDREQVVQMFRALRAFLFICRLCPSGAEEAISLLGGELDTDRTETLLRIAHASENLLATEPDGNLLHAHPKLVANILREGSWAPDELTRQLWAGLLASSCSVDAPDDSNRVFVDLLIHLTPAQARIFCYACKRAMVPAPDAKSPSESVGLNQDEMIELTGMHDLSRNATDVAYLFNLGLIQKLFDFTSYREVEGFDVTPTNLGLELYKHCHGSRDKIQPDLVEAAQAHLLTFLPPAQPVAPGSTFLNSGTPPPPDSSSGS